MTTTNESVIEESDLSVVLRYTVPETVFVDDHGTRLLIDTVVVEYTGPSEDDDEWWWVKLKGWPLNAKGAKDGRKRERTEPSASNKAREAFARDTLGLAWQGDVFKYLKTVGTAGVARTPKGH